MWRAENIQACLRDFLAATASMARKRHLASTARGLFGFCLASNIRKLISTDERVPFFPSVEIKVKGYKLLPFFRILQENLFEVRQVGDDVVVEADINLIAHHNIYIAAHTFSLQMPARLTSLRLGAHRPTVTSWASWSVMLKQRQSIIGSVGQLLS